VLVVVRRRLSDDVLGLRVRLTQEPLEDLVGIFEAAR
jgi:hypothetical protein